MGAGSLKFEDLYYPELTSEVHAELVRIGSWFNRFIGHHPVLVGGWAVWTYNPSGLGSRDVDLVFPSRASKDRLVNQYLLTSGYTRIKRSEFEEEYALVIKTGKSEERIYLDACSVGDVSRMEGTQVAIPWALAWEYQRKARIAGAEFYVPAPEVLIVMKAKAALDRERQAARSFDPFYMRHKSWKDYYDIASLLKECEFEEKLLTTVLRRCNFDSLFYEAMRNLSRKRTVLRKHKVEWKRLRSKLPPADWTAHKPVKSLIFSRGAD